MLLAPAGKIAYKNKQTMIMQKQSYTFIYESISRLFRQKPDRKHRGTNVVSEQRSSIFIANTEVRILFQNKGQAFFHVRSV